MSIAMGNFAHVDGRAERRGRDDDDDYNRLPRKGLDNVPPHLSVKYYRMDKVRTFLIHWKPDIMLQFVREKCDFISGMVL